MGALDITVKDMRLILKDKGALFTLLALPIVIIAVLGMSTGQMFRTTAEDRLVKVCVVDADNGTAAEHVIRDLSAIGGLKLNQTATAKEAQQQLKNGRSNVVVSLGKDFQNRIDDFTMTDVFETENAQPADALLSLDVSVQSGPEFTAVKELVEYVVFSAVMRVVAPEVMKRNRLLSHFFQRYEVDSHSPGGTKAKPEISHSDVIYQTVVPGFLVMFSFFLINIMANSFISERQLGTLRRLQMSRVSPIQLLVGKTLPFLSVSILQSVLLFLAGRIIFGMSWGRYPAMLFPVIFSTSIAATGLGLLLGTVVRTESQVTSYSTFLVVLLAGISGCFMPRAWLPDFMKTISLATPHAWALISYQELLTGEQPDMQVVGKCCGVLIAMGTACFSLGAWRFRSFEYPSFPIRLLSPVAPFATSPVRLQLGAQHERLPTGDVVAESK